MNHHTATAGRTLGAIALSFAMSPGGALAVPPACALVGDTFRMSDGFDAPQASIRDIVTVEDLGNGFVGWGLYADAGPERFVLQNCRSGDELIVTAPAASAERVGALRDEMVYGDGAHTLREIATAMRGAGAEAVLTQDTQGDCACRTFMLTQ